MIPVFALSFLRANWRWIAPAALDVEFLRRHTGSPYLVGPNGFFLRDPATRKPLLWDTRRNAAVPFDTPDTAFVTVSVSVAPPW